MKKLFISGIITTTMIFGGYTTVFAATLPSNTTSKTVSAIQTKKMDTICTAADASTGVVNSPIGLYMRDEASLQGTIITVLGYNSQVTIEGTQGNWYKVTADGYTGYVYSEYITTTGSTNNSTSASNSSSTNTTSGYGVISNLNYGYTLNFRNGPSTSAYIIGSLSDGTNVQILGESNGWYKIEYNGQVGYAYGEFVTLSSSSTTNLNNSSNSSSTSTTSGYGVISNLNYGYTLNFRNGPSTSAYIIGSLSDGTNVQILGKSNGWYKIEYNGQVGYVYGEFVTLSSSSTTTTSNSSSNASVTAQQIISYAEQFEGYPYVWGGSSPSTGFDCSGLVQYVFNHFGISLPRTTYEQVNCGTAVSLSDIQPGDLVFEIGTAQAPQHVGIYIGNGKILNAMDPANGVTISPLYQVVAVRNVL